MDSKKTGVPEIKPQVNRETKKERKKGGFFARLFGAGAATEGGAGLGGVVDISGAAAGGGLLATKAGLLALILAGTTVAGGIGLVGYRLFGPGADDGGDNNLSLFAAKPKSAADGSAMAPVKDGSSDSLNMLAKGNAAPKDDAAAAAALAGGLPKDQTAADASAGTAAGQKASGSINGNGDGAGATGQFRGGTKLGSSLGAFGGGMPAAGGGASATTRSDALNKPTGGTLGTLGKGAGARSMAAGMARPGRANGALGQAFGVLGDQRGGGATSSYGAGRTYDGSASSPASAIGPQAGAPSSGGIGDGTSQTTAKDTPNSANSQKTIQPPPNPGPGTNVTPWQGDIQAAEALVALATVLLIFKRKIAMMLKASIGGSAALYLLDAIIASIGLAVIALGARIGSPPYGQVNQAGALAAAGVGIMIASVGSMLTGADNLTDDAMDKAGDSLGAGMNPFILLGGGAALIGLAAAALQPPKTYPSTYFNNGIPPGHSWFSMNGLPSEQAVRRLT
jgi:hypothetical protein